MIRAVGWNVNYKRVYRTWRWEGLKVPAKKSKCGWLWLNDGLCIGLQLVRPDHVWSRESARPGHRVEGRSACSMWSTSSRARLAIEVERRLRSDDMVHNAELLNGEIFTMLCETHALIERLREQHNTVRPHFLLEYRPPAPESISPLASIRAYATLQLASPDAGA